LAKRLVATTQAMGAAASACITDMSWPIGRTSGNALEVVESWDVLQGAHVAGTRSLTLALAAEMVRLAGVARDAEDAMQRVTRALDDGRAAERFLQLVRAQGGDASRLERGEPLHPAPCIVELKAPRAGHLVACDCFGVGELVVAMGGGRLAKEDAIDPRVGLVLRVPRGARLAAGEVFAELHLAEASSGLVDRALRCFTIGDVAPDVLPDDLVLERV
jgi:thymidine phosphorylase